MISFATGISYCDIRCCEWFSFATLVLWIFSILFDNIYLVYLLAFVWWVC